MDHFRVYYNIFCSTLILINSVNIRVETKIHAVLTASTSVGIED